MPRASAFLITLPLAGVWIYLDRRTRLANHVRTLWRQPGARVLLFAAVSLSVLFTTAEAVLDHQEDELLTDVDVVVRDAALAAGAWSELRGAAEAVSDLTWAGLAGAVMTAGIGLIYRRRWRETFVLLAGTAQRVGAVRGAEGPVRRSTAACRCYRRGFQELWLGPVPRASRR
jgi:hypothetical protein